MSTLFEFPPTRSNRAKWALEELGVDYSSEMINLTEGRQRESRFTSIYPLGVVPVWSTDSFTIGESVAITLQLIDELPESGLAPVIGTPERARYYQWSVFASSELDPALSDVMWHSMHLPENERVAAIAERGRERFAARALMLSKTLENSAFLLGEKFSGADIAIGYCCNWAEYTGLLQNHPILVNYYQRLQQRPAFQKVFTQ